MDNTEISKVINRRGEEVDLDYNKILNRLSSLINMEPKLNISPHRITIKTIEGIYNKIHTYELDELSSKICGSLITTNPDYSKLASRIEISNLHKETSDCFLQTMYNANSYKNTIGDDIILIDPKLIKFTEYYKKEINDVIDYSKDYNFEYFGILTLKKSYLLKNINEHRNIILERPQHLYMRVALGINLCYVDDGGKLKSPYHIKEVLETYKLLSQGFYSHATPTLFNAGTNTSSLSSCFLLNVDDNLDHIYKTLWDTARISKWSGGIGICVTDVRSKGTLIKGTNGVSDGLVPMLKVFNDSACYVNQGGGKRKGSTAVYLEPWHADINEFLDLKKPIGDEMLRARDLFLALWIPDIFMERLVQSTKSNKIVLWSLMCPNECSLLTKTYGKEFTKAYIEYEKQGKYRKQVNIQELWRHILEIQIESGMPYIMFKDNVNRKCNQNNLGIIKSSNLCSEITIYTDKDNIGVCNLASLTLPKYINYENDEPIFDYQKLYETTKIVTYNLNKVIDNNYYPIPEGKFSDKQNRPIGIGVSGLADVFIMFKCSYTSDKAKDLNKKIFETMYFATMEASNDLAIRFNRTYHNFNTSMLSKGQFQFDLWGITPSFDKWDWETLRQKIITTGSYNSMNIALMPTASTASILGTSENFEPITSNMYLRRVLSGSFQIVNKYLIQDLIKLNIWNDNLKQKIIANEGSVQNIPEIPKDIQEIYKTSWEYKIKDLINMDRDRGAYVCQSSSSNRFMKEPNTNKLSSMHVYAWKQQLKTSSYYLRTKTITNAVKFTVDVDIIKEMENQKNNTQTSNLECKDDADECTMCSA